MISRTAERRSFATDPALDVVRSMAPEPVRIKPDPLRNARTVVTHNPLTHFFLNPHHVAYHLEHHLYPGLPHYHLPALHAALQGTGRFEGAVVERRYADSFATIFGAA